ncbi:hypothetical protein NJI34_00185 [Pseudomonas sp. S 311-6]|nr:hypothetical protein [Pseudomonas sp. S 311-6]
MNLRFAQNMVCIMRRNKSASSAENLFWTKKIPLGGGIVLNARLTRDESRSGCDLLFGRKDKRVEGLQA